MEGLFAELKAEMARVLKPRGWAAIVLGDVVVGDQRTDFCQRLLQWAPEFGFDQATALRRPILGGYARLRFEYILLLRKGISQCCQRLIGQWGAG